MVSNNIIFDAPGHACLVQEPVAALQAGEVLVRIAVSSISSGTERANLCGDLSISPYVAKPKEASFPRRCGYCKAGVVEAVGAGVTRVRVGDRVAVTEGSHRQLEVTKESNVFLIPDSVSFEDAALFFIASFPLGGIRKCRPELGESAIVMGLGMLGILSLQLLRAAGVAPILAVDPDPSKREKALACGADYALDPYAADFAAQAKALTGGGAHIGIEVTGIGAGLDGILDCMRPLVGRVALLGCTRNSDFTIDYYRKVHGPGITLIGAHTKAKPRNESRDGWWSKADDMESLIRLTELGRLRMSACVDETASPTQATNVYHRLATEKTFPLVQFDWRKL